MSDFTEQVAADLGDVFLNVDEFGKLRTIDGLYEVACVLEEGTRSPSGGDRSAQEFEGVYAAEFVLHVKKADLPESYAPAVGQRLALVADDEAERTGTVVHVEEAMGMLSIRGRWWSS